MTPPDLPTYDWRPLDPAEHQAQLAALTRRFPPAIRILDLGAGNGRLALPLAALGCAVVAVDRDQSALNHIQHQSPNCTVVLGDFTNPPTLHSLNDVPFNAALCLGNTFMLLHEPSVAANLMRTLRTLIRPDGVLLIDDFSELWADVASGNWQTGLSADGSMQLIWCPGDSVFVMRTGVDVDPNCWTVRETDTRYRLWTMGELSLLAAATGWNPPRTATTDHLTIFTHPA